MKWMVTPGPLRKEDNKSETLQSDIHIHKSLIPNKHKHFYSYLYSDESLATV